MARYYFNVRVNSDLRKDSQGTELPDIRSALRMAKEMAAEIALADSDDAKPGDQVELTGTDGAILETFAIAKIT